MAGSAMIGLPFADAAWNALADPTGVPVLRFDPDTVEDLPPPAQRLLRRSLPAGVELLDCISLDMEGEIKLGGRWLGFTARQILRAGVGFVWAPAVGGRFLRFTGADALGPDGARIEFRLFGWIPVVRGSGPDIERSAAGRLAAETVAWLPEALTPQLGARWNPVDDQHAAVTLDVAGQEVRVEVAVTDDGRLDWLGLQRWKDSAKPPAFASFGGSVTSDHVCPNGVRIAGSGTVGWEWATQRRADGEFFRYRITNANFDPSADTERSKQLSPTPK